MVSVTVFTDPGCPFAFCGQKAELRLLWHYGHAVEVTRRMIGLRPESVSFVDRGIDPRDAARGLTRFIERDGMPICVEPRPRMAATLPACRAYVGARAAEPERATALLRALRVRSFSAGEMIDDPEVLARAARDAGISANALRGWLAASEVRAGLESDMTMARAPLPEARSLAHRLAGDPKTPRYSTGSAVFERGDRRFVTVGLQPYAVFEAAMANLAPEVAARPPAPAVEEILEWAPYPLASVEIAELRGVEVEAAISELRSAGASFAPAANDGFWSGGRCRETMGRA